MLGQLPPEPRTTRPRHSGAIPKGWPRPGPCRPMFRGTLAGRQVGGLTFYQDVQDVDAAWLVYSAKPAGELPRAMMVLPLSSNW